jgi:uncharacterized membrane protein
MYPWIVFLHVIGVFLFLISHGGSAIIAFKIRGERELERIRALLELSNYPLNITWLSLLLILIPGIVAGFMGRWWSRGWIWTSIILLLAMGAAHWLLGTSYFNKIRQAAGLPWFDGRQEQPAEQPLSPEEVAAMISPSRPWLLTLIGFGGIVAITWLMMFKPF